MNSMILKWMAIAAAAASLGCQMAEQPVPAVRGVPSQTAAPAAGGESVSAAAGSEVMERRFTEGPAGPDAVQTALIWSEKYQQLSETANQLREKNIQLFEENARLKKEVETLKAQLSQTQKELEEANEFLQKMHVELNQWKADVLGFRDEMRKAEAAQLQALGKILRILGAEPADNGG
jgi:predicted RNase H-like nuclease (RuvC/YqgF family)